jgi:hypothetical protein
MSEIGDPTYYRDQLREVNSAITAVSVRGQRYKIGDRELWRGDLEWLYAERTRLEPLARGEILTETTGRPRGTRLRRVVPL